MSTLSKTLRSVASAAAAAVALNACSSTAYVPSPTSGALPNTLRAARHGSNTTPQIFISSRGCGPFLCVQGFTKDGQYVETLQGLVYPEGLAFDKRGNLYVADLWNSTVDIYSPGATSPSRTISDPDPGGPLLVTVDSHDDVWVTNTDSFSHRFRRRDNSENIMEFGHRGYLMEVVVCPHVSQYNGGLVMDRKGDVFFQGQIRGHGHDYEVVEEIPHGKTICKLLHTQLQGPAWGGLALTNTDDLVVGDWQSNQALTYAAPSYAKVIATTSFQGITRLHGFALTSDNQHIWIANELSSPEALFYDFPNAGSPLQQIAGYNAGAEDIAINF
jgi:DNA-binding beta-propeller fold protein YncE